MSLPPPTKIPHPFAELLGLEARSSADGESECAVRITEALQNPHGVVHGAVTYALADTGMGMALYPLLESGESCATIEIKMVYVAPVRGGELVCTTKTVHKGSRIAVLESEVFCGERLVAKALGTYAVLQRD